MSERTEIEWADHTWSPWRGCTKVSPGCANCYAETISRRNPAVLGSWGKGAQRVISKSWGLPYRWNRAHESGRSVRPTVFPSLCDWLDDEVPIEWLARFLALIHATPNLNWLLLTKRPENWKRVDEAWRVGNLLMPVRLWLARWHDGNAPDNVWFGASVEDQERANDRVPELLQIPAKVRWLSVEPMLGPVNLSRVAFKKTGTFQNALNDRAGSRAEEMFGADFRVNRVDWVVIGGESGPKARGCDVKWVRSLISDCRLASVPVFVKQLGSRPFRSWDGPPGNTIPEIAATIGEGWSFDHPKGGDPIEWPSDLRVREFPETCSGNTAEKCFSWTRNAGDQP